MTARASSSPPAAASPGGGRASARQRAEARWSRPLLARELAGAKCGRRPRWPRAARVFIVRDLPESCICIWDYHDHLSKWQLEQRLPGCPWHEGD